MCGFVGIFDSQKRTAINVEILTRMNQSLLHRGPDEQGIYREIGIGLGHRRLSIIDVSQGQQPFFSQDGSVVVVYNGEIYNFQEIAAELKQYAYQFQTHCDTEVIVYAWQHWQQACVNKFRGMFAFALWDKQRQTLFLARDRLGIKPVYYAQLTNGDIIFGSELKALYQHPKFEKKLWLEAVEDYFAYGYIPEPKTIYRNTYKLPPAHTLTLNVSISTLPEPQAYWDLNFSDQHQQSSLELQQELIARIKEAVNIRLMADVPLGAFLSGGVDSSAVVATMAELSPEPVKTCSIGFNEASFNESDYARQVAQQYHTDHQTKIVDANDFSLVNRLVDLYDEPYADSSALPTYRVCELAKQRVTVALSGDGGDESMAGYRRYRWHSYEEKMRSILPLGIRQPVFSAFAKIYPKADWAPKIFRAKSTLEGLARESVAGYFHSVSLISDSLRQQLFRPSFYQQLQEYRAISVLQQHAQSAPRHDPVAMVQYLDIKTYLPGDILTKVDRASMAHSLEVRVPLLDHLLLEWVAGLPTAVKIQSNQGKAIFKQALAKHLPHDLLYRPKMGFRIPMAKWFRQELQPSVPQALSSEILLDTGWFQAKFIQTVLTQHQSRQKDHSTLIWVLLMFQQFLAKNQA